MGVKRFYYQKKETKITEIKGYFDVETDYIQLYKNFIEVSHKISSVTSFKLLHWLLAERLSDENGLLVGKMFKDFNEYLRTRCGEDCIIVESTFYRAITELVNVGAINKLGKSHYHANAALFWTSDTQQRIEHLKLNEAHDVNLLPEAKIIE